ncbi:MAG: EexN family lipoprotein [Candidatus Accumulibacter sp.]|nr:EexN family lipoprotein [Accumulibacter sp.]
MKKLSTLLIYSFVALGLSGCGEKPEPVQTVDWYKEHEAERTAMIKKCENNPGELAATPNCVNATRAANKLTWSSRKGLNLDANSAKELWDRIEKEHEAKREKAAKEKK